MFATANDIDRLSKPLQSRFRKLFLPKYTETEFQDVSEKVLPRIDPSIARHIGAQVWQNGLRGDIRDVQHIGKLIRKNDGPEEILDILSTLNRYSELS